MALYYELPVYRDVYNLILMIFECTKDFSKEYKYTLGQDMKRDALQLVRNIYRANKSANKKEYLEAFLDDFELLKLEIRLCADMKVLPIKKQNMLLQHKQLKKELLQGFLSSMNSYLGIMKHYKTYRLRMGMLLKYLNPQWLKYVYLVGDKFGVKK